MMTSSRYAVSWCYREGDAIVRQTLYGATDAACIECARLLYGNPYTSDIEVIEVDTGKPLDWRPEGIGRVLHQKPARVGL